MRKDNDNGAIAAPATTPMKYFGAHVSIAGGVHNAPLAAAAIGADGFALFTKNQRQWIAPPICAEEAAAFARNCRDAGIAPAAILPHDSYLINLGNPDGDKRRKALGAFIEELRRVEALGLSMLNFHPGSGLGADRDLTLRNIADAVREAIDSTPSACAVIENTAGQGSVAGNSLDELARLLELVDRPQRCGVCIDTCHAWAAGIPLADDDGYDRFWRRFEQLIGFEKLRGMHLNDAKAGCGSHLDRHAPLGEGMIGWGLFARLAADPRIDNVPMILETPEPEKWPDEIARLKQAAKIAAKGE